MDGIVICLKFSNYTKMSNLSLSLGLKFTHSFSISDELTDFKDTKMSSSKWCKQLLTLYYSNQSHQSRLILFLPMVNKHKLWLMHLKTWRKLKLIKRQTTYASINILDDLEIILQSCPSMQPTKNKLSNFTKDYLDKNALPSSIHSTVNSYCSPQCNKFCQFLIYCSSLPCVIDAIQIHGCCIDKPKVVSGSHSQKLTIWFSLKSQCPILRYIQHQKW